MPKSFLVRTGREVVDDREKDTSKFLLLSFYSQKYVLYMYIYICVCVCMLCFKTNILTKILHIF